MMKERANVLVGCRRERTRGWMKERANTRLGMTERANNASGDRTTHGIIKYKELMMKERANMRVDEGECEHEIGDEEKSEHVSWNIIHGHYDIAYTG
jgi:hypothetical protein